MQALPKDKKEKLPQMLGCRGYKSLLAGLTDT
jgi:hypothetical protein